MIVFAIPALLVAIAVKATSKGPVLFWSDRVGQNNEIFRMPKFRSMRIDAPVVATHELKDAKSQLTPIGSFLRRSSFDEIPQLIPIFLGKMSIVGPRPALFNQHDVIEERTKLGVHVLKPGLTGWAQVNGRDEISNEEKVRYDYEYLQNQTFLLDMKIILKTAKRVLGGANITN